MTKLWAVRKLALNKRAKLSAEKLVAEIAKLKGNAQERSLPSTCDRQRLSKVIDDAIDLNSDLKRILEFE